MEKNVDGAINRYVQKGMRIVVRNVTENNPLQDRDLILKPPKYETEVPPNDMI
jgi:hypothetical protein